MRTFVVADDITGANDIAVMYAKSGLKTVTYTCGTRELFREEESVCVVDTDSRFLPGQEAYDRVYQAVAGHLDCERYFDKQCSVFRGNIGAEFDAMLDALGESFAAVVPGYPANGRTTVHSIHYVHGIRLEQSQFRRDPVHPMAESDLCRILASQTKRAVGAIWAEDLDLGLEHLKQMLAEAKKRYGYVIFDTRSEQDLALIAKAIADVKVVCGSAQIAYYLGLEQRGANTGVLALAGSLTPQTIAQTQYLAQRGYPVRELPTERIALGEEEQVFSQVYHLAAKELSAGRLVMIHTSQRPEAVSRTKAIALAHGRSNVEISQRISELLAALGRKLCQDMGLEKCIVLGGDTSASFCRAMEISGMEILEEIESGIPLLRKIGSETYFVLKSGSFGTDAFVEKAYAKLIAK